MQIYDFCPTLIIWDSSFVFLFWFALFRCNYFVKLRHLILTAITLNGNLTFSNLKKKKKNESSFGRRFTYFTHMHTQWTMNISCFCGPEKFWEKDCFRVFHLGDTLRFWVLFYVNKIILRILLGLLFSEKIKCPLILGKSFGTNTTHNFVWKKALNNGTFLSILLLSFFF